MRQLYEDLPAAAALGRRGQESAQRSMSLTTAGQKMARRLSEIPENLEPRSITPHAGPQHVTRLADSLADL
jgi:hypothetical protein